MTVEELMKPRYKVIAPYPSMKAEGLNVGDIIVCKDFDNDFSEKYWCEMNDAYPHLFRKLEWWEFRSDQNIPKYIKFNDISCFYPVERVCKGVDAPFNGFGFTYNQFLPATEQEYNDYIKSISHTI